MKIYLYHKTNAISWVILESHENCQKAILPQFMALLYMAPEVYKGETYDTRSDLYSLGIYFINS